MQELQELQKIDNVIQELEKEIHVAVPKILKIKSSKLLKRENFTERILGEKRNSPKEDSCESTFFRRNNVLYRDVPIQTHKESNRANGARTVHSYFLRLSATIENSAEENPLSLNNDFEEILVKKESQEMFKNICKKKLNLIVDNVSEILRLCDECHLASEKIANERNNR